MFAYDCYLLISTTYSWSRYQPPHPRHSLSLTPVTLMNVFLSVSPILSEFKWKKKKYSDFLKTWDTWTCRHYLKSKYFGMHEMLFFFFFFFNVAAVNTSVITEYILVLENLFGAVSASFRTLQRRSAGGWDSSSQIRGHSVQQGGSDGSDHKASLLNQVFLGLMVPSGGVA